MQELQDLTNNCILFARDCNNKTHCFQTLIYKSEYVKILENTLPKLSFNSTLSSTAEFILYLVRSYSLLLIDTLNLIKIQIQDSTEKIYKSTFILSKQTSNMHKINNNKVSLLEDVTKILTTNSECTGFVDDQCKVLLSRIPNFLTISSEDIASAVIEEVKLSRFKHDVTLIRE